MQCQAPKEQNGKHAWRTSPCSSQPCAKLTATLNTVLYPSVLAQNCLSVQDCSHCEQIQLLYSSRMTSVQYNLCFQVPHMYNSERPFEISLLFFTANASSSLIAIYSYFEVTWRAKQCPLFCYLLTVMRHSPSVQPTRTTSLPFHHVWRRVSSWPHRCC